MQRETVSLLQLASGLNTYKSPFVLHLERRNFRNLQEESIWLDVVHMRKLMI